MVEVKLPKEFIKGDEVRKMVLTESQLPEQTPTSAQNR